MSRVLECFRAVLYLSLLFLVGSLIAMVQIVMPRVTRALDAVTAIEVNTTRLEAEASGLLNASRQVVLAERSATTEQIKQIDAIARQTTALLEHVDRTVTDLDLAAKQTLAGAAVDEADISALLRQTTASLRDVGDHANLLLENATSAIDAGDTKVVMANIVVASENVRQTTADTAASMATVRRGVEYEVAQLMRPVRKVKVAGEEAVRLLGKFFGY